MLHRKYGNLYSTGINSFCQNISVTQRLAKFVHSENFQLYNNYFNARNLLNVIIVVSAIMLDPASLYPPNSTTSISPGHRVIAVAEWYILGSLRLSFSSET